MSEQESRSPDGDGPDILSRSQQNELRQSTAPARSQFSRAAEGGESDTGAGSEPADSLQVLQAQLASAEGTIQELRAELAGLKQPQTAGVVSAANECAFLEAEGTIQALRADHAALQERYGTLLACEQTALDRLKAAEAALSRVSAAHEAIVIVLNGVSAKLEAAEAARDQAQQAQARLIEYVQHKADCAITDWEYSPGVMHRPRPDCTCGLDTALRRDARPPETD